MRWFARPESAATELRLEPRLDAWDKADHPDQIRLKAYLDDTEDLVARERTDGPWALRLDVRRPASTDLLANADLDNYAYPLAYRLRDQGLVSVWCTKQPGERSSVRIAVPRDVPPPPGVLIARTSASTATVAYKEQVRAAIVHEAELPPGPVRLELSFVVGPGRTWMNLWKPTIDALDPILGRTNPERAWHPRDGRITELGMHVTVDPAVGNDVIVGIHATAGKLGAREFREDDAGYLEWIASHPDGFVINIVHGHSASGARLHHADCRTISGRNSRDGRWTWPYVKVCADRLSDLQSWATDHVRREIPPCGTCQPSA